MSTTNIFDQTTTLARSIVLDALPHADVPQVNRGSEEDPWMTDDHEYSHPDGIRAVGAKVSDLQVGDLVATHENRKSRGWWDTNLRRNNSIRDFVAQGGRLHVVVAKTDKTVEVEYLGTVDYYLHWVFDLPTLGRVEGRDTDRMSGTTQKRDVVRVGRYDEIVAAIAADPRTTKWATLHAAAEAEHEKNMAEHEAKQAADDAERLPYKAAADAIEVATGYRMFDVTYYGTPDLSANKYLTGSQGDIARLVIYGRLHLAEITTAQASEALTALGNFELVTTKG